jgi:hypothetical protein
MSDSQYDEPGSRTRQAWLRTSLGMLVVSVLVLRGMVLQGLPWVVVLVALLPATVFLAVAVARTRSLGPTESEALRSPAGHLATAATLGLALIAGAAVLAVL